MLKDPSGGKHTRREFRPAVLQGPCEEANLQTGQFAGTGGRRLFDLRAASHGIDYLLRALHHLAHDLGRTDFFCVLVGNGAAWDSLRVLATELGLDQQVWFPGVHCDVGGGYVESEAGLSKIALKWMVEQVGAFGLRFQPKRCDELNGCWHPTGCTS